MLAADPGSFIDLGEHSTLSSDDVHRLALFVGNVTPERQRQEIDLSIRLPEYDADRIMVLGIDVTSASLNLARPLVFRPDGSNVPILRSVLAGDGAVAFWSKLRLEIIRSSSKTRATALVLEHSK